MEIDWCPSEKNVCRVNRQWSVAELKRTMGNLNWRTWQEFDQLVFAYRGRSSQLHLSGAIQTSLTPVEDSDYWVATIRIRDIECAVIRHWLYRHSHGGQDYLPETLGVWRGKSAPAAPAFAEPLRGSVRETEIYSDLLNTTRRITYYLPPTYSEERCYPVVYMTDGDQLRDFGFPHVVEPLIDQALIPPLVLVAVHAAPFLPHHDRRAEEYVLGINDRVYQKHERFFTETARVWAEATLNASRDRKERALMGYSRGAVFAGNTGIRKPDVYGHVMAFSPGAELQIDRSYVTSARYYLLAGTLEEHFYQATERIYRALETEGIDVALKTRVAGHASTLWVEEFPRALMWMFNVD